LLNLVDENTAAEIMGTDEDSDSSRENYLSENYKTIAAISIKKVQLKTHISLAIELF